jgi:hypothetical protein
MQGEIKIDGTEAPADEKASALIDGTELPSDEEGPAVEPLVFPPHPRFVQGDEVLAWLRHPETVAFAYERNRAMFLFLSLVSISCLLLLVTLILRVEERTAMTYLSAAVLALASLGCVWTFIHWFFFSIRNYVAMRPGGIIVGRGERAWLLPGDRISRETFLFDHMQQGTHTIALPVDMAPARTRILLLNPFVELRHYRRFLAEIVAILLDEDEAEEADEDGESVTEAAGEPAAPDEEEGSLPETPSREEVLERRRTRRNRRPANR